MRRLVMITISLVAACTGGGNGGPGTAPVTSRDLSGIGLLGEPDVAGFARAIGPHEFEFPKDHGSHPAFRTEWWYFTGNVETADRRRFGFELTFFRVALAPSAASGSSAWRSNQLWMAHLAVTDEASKRFVAAQRLARGALGLAGGTAEPFRVWVDDWSAAGHADGVHAALELRARDGDTGIALALEAQKPIVLQGDRGLDAKGPERGNASYYYSMPRLAVAGHLTVGGSEVSVTGEAWMDREWSTSALSPGVVGWDWLALQLDDGRDLMVYRLRRADGTMSAFSSGAIIAKDGTRDALEATAIELTPQRWWRSPTTDRNYPVSWSLEIPSRQISLTIDSIVPNQEIDLTVRYWEGAVDAMGTGAARPLTGRGYLELTGY